MHDLPAVRIRTADAAELGAALADTRRATLATFAAFEQALGPRLELPYSAELNPPRWELGHVGWFQDGWLARFPAHERARGAAADPLAPRRPPRGFPQADAWFDSSRVAHTDRWGLPLPSADALREDLARGLAETLALLRETPQDDAALYFFRLVLFHEDMHHEAAVYMAQQLGIPLDGFAPHAQPPAGEIEIPGGTHTLGRSSAGFVFDNEVGPHEIELAPFRIDAVPVDWQRYLAFVGAGGYTRREFWSEAGWAWREALGLDAPRYLRRTGAQHSTRWQRQAFGRWFDVDPDLPAMNLAAHEAEAWCAWAGRRLPTEAEWDRAADTPGFEWGAVWEWTASPFAPFPGFVAHPYRDYSVPWFGSRRVLRGASFATAARMRHPRYRNFFAPGRNDIFAGLRSCAREA